MIIDNSGNVGIGTINPTYKLSVLGTIRATEVRVETGWSDFVFDDNYKLSSLDDVEKFIQQHCQRGAIEQQTMKGQSEDIFGRADIEQRQTH